MSQTQTWGILQPVRARKGCKNSNNRVAVMYVGQLVELAPTGAVFARSRHPYTAALMRAVPVPDPRVATVMRSSKGRCRARPRRHPAAISIRAAGSPKIAAAVRRRFCAK